MIGIETLVWFVFVALVCLLVVGLLWFVIGYVESQGWGPPVAFKVLRVVFVLLVVFALICLLLGLIGHPVVRVG